MYLQDQAYQVNVDTRNIVGLLNKLYGDLTFKVPLDNLLL